MGLVELCYLSCGNEMVALKKKNQNLPVWWWCGVVVVWWWWCGGGGVVVVFLTDYNTTLRLH